MNEEINAFALEVKKIRFKARTGLLVMAGLIFVSLTVVDKWDLISYKNNPIIHFVFSVVPWIALYLFYIKIIFNVSCPKCGNKYFGPFFKKGMWFIDYKKCSSCKADSKEIVLG